MAIFRNQFSSIADIEYYFQLDKGALDKDVIIYANYECESYDGWATVILIRNRRLMMAVGTHCSCYGLEGQFEPEPCHGEALSRAEFYIDKEDRVLIKSLIGNVSDDEDISDEKLALLILAH